MAKAKNTRTIEIPFSKELGFMLTPLKEKLPL